MTLQSESIRSLLGLEAARLNKRIAKREQRRSRSQSVGKITGYDADQGHAIVATELGTSYAQSITTSSINKVAVSVQATGLAFVDAKPRTQ